MSTANRERITLVLGGARSGKSAYAESLFAGLVKPWGYIATAEVFDEEMHARIAAHQTRRGSAWETREAPIALPAALRDASGEQPLLVDCLTLWLSNLMHSSHNVEKETAGLIAALAARQAPTVLVSNEVGLGIVPENSLARAFRDEAGRLNQRIAAAADRVVLVAAGLPLSLKG